MNLKKDIVSKKQTEAETKPEAESMMAELYKNEKTEDELTTLLDILTNSTVSACDGDDADMLNRKFGEVYKINAEIAELKEGGTGIKLLKNNDKKLINKPGDEPKFDTTTEAADLEDATNVDTILISQDLSNKEMVWRLYQFAIKWKYVLEKVKRILMPSIHKKIANNSISHYGIELKHTLKEINLKDNIIETAAQRYLITHERG